MSLTHLRMRIAIEDGLLKEADEPTPLVRQLREEMKADPEGRELERKLREELKRKRPTSKVRRIKVKMPPIRRMSAAPPLSPALATLALGGALTGAGGLLIRKSRKDKEKAAEANPPVQVAPQEELPEPKDVKPQRPWVTAAKDIGAFGAGVGAGYGALSAANALSKKRTGRPLVSGRFAGHAIPVTMGVGGLLFSHWQNTLLDRMREQAAARRASGSEES